MEEPHPQSVRVDFSHSKIIHLNAILTGTYHAGKYKMINISDVSM